MTTSSIIHAGRSSTQDHLALCFHADNKATSSIMHINKQDDVQTRRPLKII